MTAWAVSDTHHEGRVAGDRLDIIVGKARALSAVEIEQGVRCRQATLVAPATSVFAPPAAWALVSQTHDGKTWKVGERVDLTPPTRAVRVDGGYVDVPPHPGGMPAGVIEGALRNGMVTLIESGQKEQGDA